MPFPPAPLDDTLTDASPGTPDAHTGYHNDERTAINDTVAEVEAHEADTTGVHGITDTAALETSAGAQAKADAAQAAAEAASDPTGTAASAVAAEATARANADNARVLKAGDAMTGALTLPGDPTADLHATTRAYVLAQIAALVASAPGTLDTLNELATAIGDDPNFATTLTTLVGTKLAKASNLSDLANVSTALTNLGLSANGKSLVTAADYAAMRTLLALVVGTNVQAWDADLDTLAAGGAGATTLLRSLLDSTYGAFDAEVKLTAKFTATAAVGQVVGASGNQLQTSFVARGAHEKVTVELCGLAVGQAFAVFSLLWADNASASFPLWQAASTGGGITLKSGATLEALGNVDVDSFDTIRKSVLIPTTPGHTYNVQVIVSIVGGGLFIPSVGLGGGGSWSSIAATPDRRKVYIGGLNKVVVLNTPSHAGRDQAWDRSPRHQTGGSFAVGGTATGLSVTPDGTRLVVASTDGHVYVVDTATDAIVGTYTMPGTTPQPLGVACVSNTTAYVSDATNNKVYPFTISSGAFGTAITVGTTPLRVHANSAGTYVAVPNNGTNTLSIIKVSDNSVATVTFTASARPASVAWMPDSSALWVVDSANKKVISVTTPTGTPAVGTTTTAFNPGGGIGAIAIDADGQTAWVSGLGTGADHNVHMAQLWVSGPYAGSWFITDVNNDWGAGSTTGANDGVIDAAGNIMWADYNNGYLENPGCLLTCDPTSGFTNEYGHMVLEALQ